MKLSSLNTKQRSEYLKNHSQAELLKQLIENPVSDPKELECFEWPDAGEFFSNFFSMLWDLIKYFPSALFRGIASAIDPAYKEMKLHWEGCRIEDLNWTGVDFMSADRDDIKAGLTTNDNESDGEYTMVLPTGVADLGWSTYRLLRFDAQPFKNTIERLTGYMYKGPQSLISGAFAFEIPCADISARSDEYGKEPFHLDRYGHPMSPFTTLALSTLQLPGDLNRRQQSGTCDEEDAPYSIGDIEQRGVCDEPEPTLSGPIKPEDYE